MKIYIGSDHAGYELKEKLKDYLLELGYEIDDKGPFVLNEGDDYPDFTKLVAVAVASNKDSMGIIFGGSGQGEAMCANKTKGIRASVYYGHSLDMIKVTREHNNANILSLGARFISTRKAKKAVKLFIQTPFSNDERHIRRINKLEPIN
jgi:ribose 5-phosphate isomerase B